jgi:diguanylate cyclase (GGDEF)-like protein
MDQTNSGHRSHGNLPAEVYTALVATLFGTVGSFLSGILGGLLVPSIAWARSHDPVYLACTAVVLAFSALRLAVLLQRRKAGDDLPLAKVVMWERLYGLGAIGFMTSVGVTAAILFTREHDALSTLYGVVITMGCVGALAGRNSGRPWIVYGQVMGLCLPLTVVLLFEFDSWYWGLAAILVLVMTSVKSTTRFLNGIIVSALMTGREASIQRSMFGTALDSMSHGLCMGDHDGVITVVNRRLREFFRIDCPVEGLTVTGLAEVIASNGRMSAAAEAKFVLAWETHVAKRDASVFSDTIAGRIYDFRCEPMDEGGFVVVAEDVTEARIASREIERMAHFDALTGLPNRMLFHSQLEEQFLKPLPEGRTLALLSVDLDQFKEVNDSRGHPAGDELLRHVARRLRQTVQATDLVARFGGDEFQVLLKNPADMDAVGSVAQRIIDTLSAPYSVDGTIINIGATIGLAIAPTDATDADELLRCADMALYQAKAAGRGTYRAFEPAMDSNLRRKRQVERELRDAIGKGRLEVHYQPVVDSKTGQIVACEALVRMRQADGGLMAPGDFIPVAEESGLIVQVGDFVLRQACRDAATWPAHVRVAVNFSAKQFVLRADVVRDIKEALAASGLEAHRLEVEITESTIMDAKDAEAQLRDISAAGVRISLDDFGTGYSSLSYLRQFPVDKIKIDRSFAQDVNSRASQAVIGSVSVLAQLLAVELVIEGIETKDQLQAVKSWNVHLVQGYLYSRPRPLQDILPLLNSADPFGPRRLQSVA